MATPRLRDQALNEDVRLDNGRIVYSVSAGPSISVFYGGMGFDKRDGL